MQCVLQSCITLIRSLHADWLSRDNIPAPERGHQIPRCHKFVNRALVKMKCTMWRDWLESFHLLTCIEFLERPLGISTTKESLNMINTTLLGRNWSTSSHLLHLMNCGLKLTLTLIWWRCHCVTCIVTGCDRVTLYIVMFYKHSDLAEN